MNLNKSKEFFDPTEFEDSVHIIGCGSIGSTVAENLARFGIENFILYDFDTIEPHNLANQMFYEHQIGRLKTLAVAETIKDINKDATIICQDKGYISQPLSGYVFLCVDSIEKRREIALMHKNNPGIKAMFDFRTRLVDAQSYGVDWHTPKEIDTFLRSTEFTHDEAKEETPTSACGVQLSVNPTIRTICSYGVVNFINFVKTGKIKRLILSFPFDFSVEAY